MLDTDSRYKGEKHLELNIIYEDNHLLVCEKPSGIPSQSSKIGSQDMVSILKNYLYEKEGKHGEPYLGLIHRLDQPVQGAMVFAKNPFSAKELSKQAATDIMKKYYLAVICGKMEQEEGILIDYLLKNGRENVSAVVSEKTVGAKKAELKYRVLDRKEEKELLQIQLITGRHHQIRVQLASRGKPLWGDRKYGSEIKNKEEWNQIALCAYQLEFIHPKYKKNMKFQINPSGSIFELFHV